MKTTIKLDRLSRARRLEVIREVSYPRGVTRPLTRGDCLPGGSNEARPCPFVSCRHHMLLEVADTGNILLPFGHEDVSALPFSCSLDAAAVTPTDAEGDGDNHIEIGRRMNLTRERVRQIVEVALHKAREHMRVFVAMPATADAASAKLSRKQAYNRDYYAKRKARGVCVCGTYARPGLTTCGKCPGSSVKNRQPIAAELDRGADQGNCAQPARVRRTIAGAR
jgi:hypothetical protein